jgi:hypothetical protein
VTVTVGPDSASTTDLPATPAPDPSCPSQAGAGTSSTGPGAVPVTVSHGGGVVAAPGTGTVRLPGTGRCLTPRTIHVRLHLARGARLLRVSARINGRHRAVRVGRHGLIAVRLPAGRRRAVKLHLAIRVRTRRGVRTLYINRRYTTC